MGEQVNRKQRKLDWEIRMYKNQNALSNYMIKENKKNPVPSLFSFDVPNK